MTGAVTRGKERPGQRLELRPGRAVLQSKIALGEPAKAYLVRVILDVNVDAAAVVTVYRTSKIAKYWSGEP